MHVFQRIINEIRIIVNNIFSQNAMASTSKKDLLKIIN